MIAVSLAMRPARSGRTKMVLALTVVASVQHSAIDTSSRSRVACNLCGADDYAVLYGENVAQPHQIVRCCNCGLMYANPQDPTDVDKIRVHEPGQVPIELAYPQYFQKQHVQIRDYRKIIGKIGRIFPDGGSVLEIGANVGVFLNEWQENGWEALGIDPDEDCSIYARKRYGIDILPKTIHQAAFENEMFDVVVMLHVIEHVSDPLADLDEIYRVLKPGGVLVIETPKYDSLLFRLLGKRERSLSCEGHIFFFTTKTLRALTGRAGFRPLAMDVVGRTLTVDRLLYNVGVISKSPRFLALLERVGPALGLDHLVIYLNMRDMMRLYCRKPA